MCVLMDSRVVVAHTHTGGQAEEELPLKPMEHDEHEGLDEQSLKEHEEVFC